jgi:protein-tyrosine phosphatase
MTAYWVSRRLAFGSAITTWGHVEQLKALGVTHVINLRHGKHSKKVREFKNLWLPFRDDMQSRPRWFYRRALRFYKRAMRKPNTKVFVMCHHGICRSPSLAYFFMRSSGKSSAKAERRIKRARPAARVVPDYRESGEKYLHQIQ